MIAALADVDGPDDPVYPVYKDYVYRGCFKVSGIFNETKLAVRASRNMTADEGFKAIKAIYDGTEGPDPCDAYRYYGLIPTVPTWMAKPRVPASASKAVDESKQLALLS
jgi:hypothetical protein